MGYETIKNKWNYVSTVESSTGYEDVMNKLRSYEKYMKDTVGADGKKTKVFNTLTESEKERLVQEVYDIYRGKNIFPIVYYNQKGVAKEIKKCIDKDVSDWDGKVLNLRYTQGSGLGKFFNRNMFDVVVRDNPDTQLKRFYQEKGLKKAIEFCFRYDTGVRPAQVQAGLRMTSSVATNFPAMRAKALYEHFTPKGGTILDFAHGFGGRILGALSSKNDYKYIGIDPNTETSENVQALGEEIEKVTGRTNSFELHCIGSEEYIGEDESIDFAFSSPPYFSLERYTDEETQSYNKYSDIDIWLEGYVRPTVKMLYRVLKPNRYYAVNIADFKIGSRTVEFVNDWKRISEEEGFTYVKNIPMKLQVRTGNRGINDDKQEGIFVFYKGE